MSVLSRYGWWVLGAVLVIAGVLVVLLDRASQPELGWFAYTPLSEEARGTQSSDWAMSSSLDVAFDGGAFVSWWLVAGAGVAVLGVLVLVGRAAYLRGRRSSRA